MNIIAHIENDLPEKFGIPRQSGLVDELLSTIVFEPEYRNLDALRGLEGYDYLWLIWQFEGMESETWSPTVRPPRLGGNTRIGVFATRSPNRPNPIGLSSVKIVDIQNTDRGSVIVVSGADLRSGTGIYDIKPYLAYCDSHPDAKSGFAGEVYAKALEVEIPENLQAILPKEKRKAALSLLSQDPRPSYHNDPDRIYGMRLGDFDIRFKVNQNKLLVTEIIPLHPDNEE